jgi:cell division protein ZapA (FtsZ GTPase activity inhibitor)
MAKITALGELRASLTAQLSYEEKRDFNLAFNRLNDEIQILQVSLAEAIAKCDEIEETERHLHQVCGQIDSKVQSLREKKREELDRVKSVSGMIAKAFTTIESLRKKVSAAELLIERDRAHLHEILQKAVVEEISLPTVSISATKSSDASASIHSDLSLRWEGSRTDDHRSEESSESSSYGSTHFSKSDNTVVAKDASTICLVDLSSIRSQVVGKGTRRSLSTDQQEDHVNKISEEISRLLKDLEGMQVNYNNYISTSIYRIILLVTCIAEYACSRKI